MKTHNKIVLISLMTIISICAHCSAQENLSSCFCGRPGEKNCGIDDIYTKLRRKVSAEIGDPPTNQQFCYKYRLLGTADCENAVPKVLSSQLSVTDLSDGNSDFQILTPNYNTGQCYNPSEYCIAYASCSGDDEVLTINPHLADSALTFNEESASTRCTDRMQFFNGTAYSDPFCGEDVGSKTKYELPNNFELHFYSSLCCQNCGSYIWMSCSRPQYSRIVTKVRKVTLLDEQRIYVKLFINVWNRQMLYWVRKTLLIPDGSSVRFKHRNVIITSKNAPVNIFSGIRKLFVFDEKTKHYYLFWQKAPKIFKISGVLYIGYYKAWFVATEQESPIERRTTSEAAFVRRAVEFLKPFYGTPPLPIRDDVFPSPPSALPPHSDDCFPPGDCFPPDSKKSELSEYKPDCTYFNDRIRVTCPIRDCSTRGEQAAYCSESKEQLKVSTDFFTRHFASLIIKTLTPEKPKGKSYYHRGYYDYLGKYTKYRYPSYAGGYPKGPQGPQGPESNCPVLINCMNRNK